MAKKLKIVPLNPGSYRLSFTKREYDMLLVGLRRIQSQRPGPTMQKQLPRLMARLQHAKRKIDRQLEMYRKENNLERCELWDEGKKKEFSRSGYLNVL